MGAHGAHGSMHGVCGLTPLTNSGSVGVGWKINKMLQVSAEKVEAKVFRLLTRSTDIFSCNLHPHIGGGGGLSEMVLILDHTDPVLGKVSSGSSNAACTYPSQSSGKVSCSGQALTPSNLSLTMGKWWEWGVLSVCSQN